MDIQAFAEPKIADVPPLQGDAATALSVNPAMRVLPKPVVFPSEAGVLTRVEQGKWRPPAVAAQVLLVVLNRRWQGYYEALLACQCRFSERAVHDLRVATRRLLAQLFMLSAVLGAPEADKACRALKRRLKALGALRDAHVLRLSAEAQTQRFPELVLVRAHLERQEARLEKSVAVKVRAFKTRKLERWIFSLGQRLARRAVRRNQTDGLTQAVLQATATAFREVVRRRQAVDPAMPRTVHRTRLAFKRFRYMVEALSPDFTGLQPRHLRALARYQRRMGNLQDLEVMQNFLTDFVGRRPAAEPLLGPFHRYLQQRRRRTLRAFLRSADELYQFWPPPAEGQQGQVVPTLNAA